MTDDINVPIDLPKRRGRPPKDPAAPVIPAHGRQSLEDEEKRLDQEEAAFQARRNLLREKKEKQQTRCAILLGEALLLLAETEAEYRNTCVNIANRMPKSDDRDMVSSWIPEAKSAQGPEPSTAVEDEKLSHAPKRPERRGAAVAMMAPAAMSSASPGPHANSSESNPKKAQDDLKLLSASEQPAGATAGA